jgi:hypothetical protein
LLLLSGAEGLSRKKEEKKERFSKKNSGNITLVLLLPNFIELLEMVL